MRTARLVAPVTRFVPGLALVVLALLLWKVLSATVGPLPAFITLYPAVILTAIFFGPLPGAAATALATLLGAFWIMAPRGQWKVERASDVLALVMFAAIGVIIVAASAHYRRALQRNADLERDLAVRETVSRLRFALDAANAGTWEWDLETNENTWSEELWKVYGLEPHSCTPSFDAWLQTVLPEDRDRAGRAVTDAAARGTEMGTEWRVRDRDGSIRWLMSSGRPLVRPDGTVARYTGIVLDVTERHAAEEALRASEERMKAHLENSPLAVIEFDAAFKVTRWSAQAEHLFGWTAEEMVGRAIATVPWVHEDDIESVARESAGLVSGERPRTLNFNRNHRKDGSVVHCEWYSSAIYDTGGRLLSVLSLVLDVTERGRAEEAVRRASAQLAAERDRLAVTLRSIGDAVIATDETGRVELLNGVAEQLTGWTAEDARARPIQDVLILINERSREPAASPVSRVLSEGVVVGMANHTALVARNGTERPIADSAAPIRDAQGRVTGAVLVFRDQTEERKAELALRESEARLRLLAEGLPQLVWTADENGSLDYFNARWRDYTGQAEGSEVWESVIHPDDREHVIALWQAAVHEQRVLEVEHRLRRADGEYRWYLRRAILLGRGDGARARWFGTCTDVHDLKLSQEALRQADRLKEDFLLMASHEFRTPLTALRLQAELAKQRSQKLTPPDERLDRYLSAMNVQIRRLEGLLGMLLDISQLNAGKFRLDLAVLDLADLVLEVLERFKSEADASGMEVRASLRSVRGQWDRKRLDQVITNLVSNAIKYGNHQPLEVQIEVQADEALLIIRDRGIGIAPETLPHLFEHFERGTNTAGFAGLGLGLWIAKRVVEAHAGRIAVESQPNAGSTFTVALPRSPPG